MKDILAINHRIDYVRIYTLLKIFMIEFLLNYMIYSCSHQYSVCLGVAVLDVIRQL